MSAKQSQMAGIPLLLAGLILLSGCTATDDKFQTGKSYLEQKEDMPEETVEVSGAESATTTQEGRLIRVPGLEQSEIAFQNKGDLADNFSDSKTLTLAAEEMSLNDYVHYVFGELLQVNYVLGDGIASAASTITLNIQDKISPRQLFETVERQLLDNNVGIKKQDDIFYIHNLKEDQQGTVVGYGRSPESVPNGLNVIQIVPLRYNYNSNLLRTLRDVTGAKVSSDIPQGVLFISGDKQQVVRSLELLSILDRPGTRSRNIAFLQLQFLSPESFVESMNELLQNEGLTSGPGTNDSRVSFVKIPQMAAVAVFASEEAFIDRVEFWAEKLDRPAKGSERQYFIYSPKYARASDLGQSLQNLISGRNAAANRAERNSENRGAEIEGGQSNNSVSASNDDLQMVVDDRSNTLIFNASGQSYQQLLPLIKRLDIMPRQVMLELTIAEVTLTDEFRYGVDVAFNSGNFTGGSSFGGTTTGGGTLGWLNGNARIDVEAFESNNLVNILSKPTLLVRDGMDASILVGTDIPVVGQTTSNPTTGTTRSVEYRKTGVEVKVTPTVNAQGVIIMTIDQNNSNEVDGGSSVEGNPQIFERNLSTEVVAESGQTIVLGGLISENSSEGDSGVPILRDIPLLGGLFTSKNQSTTKTELVIMVTPRVLDRNDEWRDIKLKLNEGMEFIEVNP